VTDSTTSLRAGSRFGNYEIRTELGRGGMGTVYEAYDTVNDRIVALKVLASHLSSDPAFRARFLRESRAAAKLEEPHVIPIHTRGEVAGTLFIDMRRVQGVDLGALLKDGPLTPDRAVAINSQIASALDAAHAEGLIHRDVKPENILVTRNDFAYLVDFGIAEAPGETRLTRAGDFIGSVGYMAPERFTGEPLTAASDIYSLGCVLFESLTGTAPYPSASTPQAIAGHTTMAPPRPSEVNPRVPRSFDEVISRVLAKEPDDRYGSAGAFARAAQRALPAPTVPTRAHATLPVDDASMPTQVATPPPKPPILHRQQGPGSNRWVLPSLLAAAAVIAVIAVAVAIVLVQGQSGDPVDGTATNDPGRGVTTSVPTTGARPTGTTIPSGESPPLEQGLDDNGASCGQGVSQPNETGFGSHAGRGTPETTCRFAGNVLAAYWEQYGRPTSARRTVSAPGSVDCRSTGGQCDGANFVMKCEGLGPEPWITCTGGSNARVFLY
jgi:serine/threonine protein kinase